MDDLLKEMESYERPAPGDRERRRRFLGTVSIVGLAFVGVGQLATGALFEDSANAAVSMASGNVAVQANGSASTTLAAVANMAPGDTVYRPVAITNTGSLDLRYAITGVTSSDPKNLSSVVRYSLYSDVLSGPCSLGNVAGGTLLKSNIAIGTSTTPVLGSNANGQDTDDRGLAAGGGADTLCVGITLPLATTSTFASASAAVTLTFDAEQTANN